MQGFPVQIVGGGIDWPAWVQAVGSVVAIVVSVFLGVWLQDRERRKKDVAELRNQVVALTAIGERCVQTLARLDKRAREQTITKDILGWLTDEAEATEEAAAAIDLMTLRSPEITKHVAELQEATRTGRRRLGYVARTVRSDGVLKLDDFEAPLDKAKVALAKIKDFSVG